MCNPSSSEVPAAVVDEAAGLGGWRAFLPTPSGSDENSQPWVMPNNTQQDASSSRHMPRCSTEGSDGK